MPAKNAKQSAPSKKEVAEQPVSSTKKEVVEEHTAAASKNEAAEQSSDAKKGANKNESVANTKKNAPAKKAPAANAAGAKKAPASKKVQAAAANAEAKKASPPKKEKAEAASSEDEEDEERGSGYRYFKILATRIIPQNSSPQIATDHLSLKGGRFKGRNPMQAAKKAFTKICNIAAKSGYEGDCSYIFTIQETSQKSNKKEFTYQGERHRLPVPQKIIKEGNTYEVKFGGNVKSYKSPSSESSESSDSSSSQPAKKTKKNVRIETPAEQSAAAESSAAAETSSVSAAKAESKPAVAEQQPTKSAPKQAPKGGARGRGAK